MFNVKMGSGLALLEERGQLRLLENAQVQLT